MTTNNNNERIFKEIVSIEGWYNSFTEEINDTTIHARIRFHEGFFSAKKEKEVSFKLNLKRAMLIAIIPTGEPLNFEADSVNEFARKRSVEHQAAISKNAEGSINAKLNLKSKGNILNLSSTAEGGIKRANKTSVTICDKDQGFKIAWRKASHIDESHHAWEIQPSFGEFLEGSPWEAAKTSLVNVLNTKFNEKLVPALKFDLWCRAEDLSPREVKVGGTLFQTGSSKEKAVEAVIKQKLIENSLKGEVEETFGLIQLASIMAESKKR